MLSKVHATTRAARGKNENRRLRALGLIPAVAYGKGKSSVALQVAPAEIISALHSERGRNVVLEVEVDGKDTFQAMISEYQYHPVSRALLHADLKAVDDQTFVEVKVPLVLTGKCKGVVMGGKLRQVSREVPVRCLAKDIPVQIEHDITELEIEGHVRVENVKAPNGVTILFEARRTLAAIDANKRVKGEEEAADPKDAKKK